MCVELIAIALSLPLALTWVQQPEVFGGTQSPVQSPLSSQYLPSF